MRSLLVVAADSDSGLDRALGSGADVIVVDLADSAAGAAGSAARRRRAAAFLGGPRGAARLFVRIGRLASDLAADDLDAVVPARPDGIVLRGAAGGSQVTRLSAMLRPREATAGIDDGAIAIIAMAGDSAAGLFALGSYAGASARLAGLGWDANALAADLGGTAGRDAGGGLGEPTRLARALTLAAAAAAGVPAFDTAFDGPGGLAALDREARTARRDGFAGKFTSDPAEVPAINRAFARAAPDR